MTEKTIDVLVIDDDDITAEMVQRALRKLGGMFTVVAAHDGREGLEILRGSSKQTIKRPCVILLDLNMPRMNGFEFLEAIRNDTAHKDNVIFVLTTSDADTDRSRAYHEQVAGYMIKSQVGPQFARLATLLQDYGNTVSLPD
jgi:CheY-like chemotaxis protein